MENFGKINDLKFLVNFVYKKWDIRFTISMVKNKSY